MIRQTTTLSTEALQKQVQHWKQKLIKCFLVLLSFTEKHLCFVLGGNPKRWADNSRLYSHNFGDFVFYKSKNLRSSFLENLAKERNKALNQKARKTAAEYYLEVLLVQYNTLLFNCEKSFAELINYRLFAEFKVPLFEGKTFDQYLIILMVLSLGNIILRKVWAKLLVLREKL